MNSMVQESSSRHDLHPIIDSEHEFVLCFTSTSPQLLHPWIPQSNRMDLHLLRLSTWECTTGCDAIPVQPSMRCSCLLYNRFWWTFWKHLLSVATCENIFELKLVTVEGLDSSTRYIWPILCILDLRSNLDIVSTAFVSGLSSSTSYHVGTNACEY